MFVTLKEFFDNFRIRNGDKPNETVFNRPLFRLKREIRELKSVVDILSGVPIEPWNQNKFYERDEYVTYNNGFYRSVNDGNVGNQPGISDRWVQEHFATGMTAHTHTVADITDFPSLKFNIKTVSSGYRTTSSDFDGRTLIRVDGATQNANITVTKPTSESFIGLTLTIRKVSNNNSSLTILPASNVTISPSDLTTLRREGSTVTLVYIGNGVYDAFGELP